MSKFALLAAILLVSGCSRPLSPADVPGRYTWKREGGADTLNLMADGRYVHGWRDHGGIHSQTGRWVISSRNQYKGADDGCLYVDIDGYAAPAGLHHQHPSLDDLALCGRVDLEGPFLIINDDKLWAYRKDG